MRLRLSWRRGPSGLLDQVEQAIASQVDFDPHWFRRAFHSFGACFIAYYLAPATGLAGAIRGAMPLALLAGALGLEAYRISGRMPTEAFFGLREYERRRISGYVYFGIATVSLVYLFPQPLAVACILGAAIGDPIIGEIRRMGHVRASLVAGLAFVLACFLLVGFHPLLAVFGAAVMVGAENVKIRWLDDDLLMPLLPAVAILALASTAILSPLGVAMPPDPFPFPLEVPPWLR